MKNKKKNFKNWVKEHKTELIFAGVSVSVILTVILGVKNQDMLEETWNSFRKLGGKEEKKELFVDAMLGSEIDEIPNIVDMGTNMMGRTPHNVDRHIRNLHEGWKASAEKIATAAEQGYNLLPGQTWVEAYRTGNLAA